MTAEVPKSAEVASQASNRIHVLTLTPFYPHAVNDAAGCFIAEPLSLVEKLGIRNSVIAVQPFYRSSRSGHSRYPAEWKSFFAFPSGIGLPSAGAFLFASIVADVRRLHASNPVQLIHAHSALPCGHAAVLISRELGIPFVITVHGLDAYSTNQVKGLPGRWCERITRMVYRSAKSVICVSEKVREQVMTGAHGKIETAVVYNGVDTERFSPGNESPSAPTILSVGTLIPIKGHELLLRAIAAVRSEFPDVLCKIVGEGQERQRLGHLAVELGIADKVTFVPRQTRNQIADDMKQCTLFALPSRYEALGCVYLEAMATAKPVIACFGQGIEEIIRNGVNGLLMSPGDLEVLVNALGQLLRSAKLRMEIGQRARRTILDGLTLKHQALQLAEIYEECAR